jgi:hypothetical protein
MENLVSLIGQQVTPGVIDALSGAIGASPSQTQTATQAAIPALVAGMAKQGSSVTGAQQLLGMLSQVDGSGDLLGNLTGALGGPAAGENLTSTGTNFVTSLFGNDVDKIVNTVAGFAGIRNEAVLTLLRTLAPIALAALGKVVSSSRLDASGLSNLLAGQKDFIAASAPKGLTDVLGIGSFSSVEPPKVGLQTPQVSVESPKVSSPVRPAEPAPPPPQSRSMNWLWWLLGALVLLALLWYFFLRPAPTPTNQLPAEAQAPVCAAVRNLETTIAGLPPVTADTTLDQVAAARDQVRTAYDGVVAALAAARPQEAQALADAVAAYESAVNGVTGTTTLGEASQQVAAAQAEVATAQANLLQGLNCQ